MKLRVEATATACRKQATGQAINAERHVVAGLRNAQKLRRDGVGYYTHNQ